jgi:hypothetical protein
MIAGVPADGSQETSTDESASAKAGNELFETAQAPKLDLHLELRKREVVSGSLVEAHDAPGARLHVAKLDRFLLLK